MKARELSKLLEVIVRKVIREELKPIIMELNENKRTKTKKTIVKKTKKKVDPLDVSNVLNEHRVKSKTKVKFAKDSMINQLLTETYDNDEWRDMNGSNMFTSQNAQAFGGGNMGEAVGYGSKVATVNNMTPSVDPEGRPMNVNLEGTGVGKALTRDYSALMKKLNNKKGA
tara:strand:- start:478 stop:987 length:510 start_codon:yes stop_codon:yes gene_type:complete